MFTPVITGILLFMVLVMTWITCLLLIKTKLQKQPEARKQDARGGDEAVGVLQPMPEIPARIAIDQNAGNSAPGTYPQLGYLKPSSSASQASLSPLPLYGRHSLSRVGRAYYYTIIPGSGIKVPLHSSNRDCMEEVGCEELYTGDNVTVPDSDQSVVWSVVMYKYNRY